MPENQELHEEAYISSQTNPYARVDEEMVRRGDRLGKDRKCFVFLLASVVTLACVFLIIGLVFLRVRTPKFRVRTVSFDTFQVNTSSTNSSSFHIKMVAQLGVKNSNFGKFKYESSMVEFYYMGVYKVGEAYVWEARVRGRSTRKFKVAVDLSSINVPADVLSKEFANRPIIALTIRSRLRGRVKIMKIVKKKKSPKMDCSMEINHFSKRIEHLSCK